MLTFLATNWYWLLFVVAMLLMHVMHGRHGSHAGHDGHHGCGGNQPVDSARPKVTEHRDHTDDDHT